MPDYFLGLDLGQANDPSALAVLERTVPTVEIPRPNGMIRKEQIRHYGCRALKRWPLGTPYTAIVSEMATLTGNKLFRNAKLVIDATGVGRPVVDMFRDAHLRPDLIPVMITSGTKESFHDGYRHVAKLILISTLQVLLQQRRLQFAKSLPETPRLVKELQNYRVNITPALNETFNAREGEHDDLILALALAAWQGEREPIPVQAKMIVLRPGLAGYGWSSW
jgi:hypothetical protein